MKSFLGWAATLASALIIIFQPELTQVSAFAGGFAIACFILFIVEGN